MDVNSQGERRSEAPILLGVVNNYYVFKETLSQRYALGLPWVTLGTTEFFSQIHENWYHRNLTGL